jgi:hypothetical protein
VTRILPIGVADGNKAPRTVISEPVRRRKPEGVPRIDRICSGILLEIEPPANPRRILAEEAGRSVEAS